MIINLCIHSPVNLGRGIFGTELIIADPVVL